MKLLTTLLLSTALTSTGIAQSQLVRGDVDSIQHTRTFVLDCTNIQLVSTTVNLQALHDASRQKDIEYEMLVTDVSQQGRTILNVLSAKQIPELLDMGNIRLGRSDRWHVLGNNGDIAIVYLTGNAAMTSYLPLGSLGTWVLGSNFIFFNAGFVSNFGRFEFFFQPPNDPRLVGATFTSQAITVTPSTGNVLITNPQCKQVRSK